MTDIPNKGMTADEVRGFTHMLGRRMERAKSMLMYSQTQLGIEGLKSELVAYTSVLDELQSILTRTGEK